MNNMLKIIGFILLLLMLKSCVNSSNYDNSQTSVEQSRYNTMSPSDYHEDMKSENLQYADIAWHAKNTYGWPCDEIVSLSKPIATTGNELHDPALISELVGNYQIATCSSGLKLRVYPRKDTYPVITNINGGWD